MHTCSRWYNAIAAGPPALVPAAVLACPPLKVIRLRSVHYTVTEAMIEEAYATDTASTVSLIGLAATLPCRTWRVRLEGVAQVRQGCIVHEVVNLKPSRCT